MKYFELTKEEKKILADFENEKLRSVPDMEKTIQLHQKVATNTLNKTKNINIRLSEKVLQRLKAKAAKEGIPYQTLASSILHRFVAK